MPEWSASCARSAARNAVIAGSSFGSVSENGKTTDKWVWQEIKPGNKYLPSKSIIASSALRFRVVDLPSSAISPLAETRTASSLLISPDTTSTIFAFVISNLISAILNLK